MGQEGEIEELGAAKKRRARSGVSDGEEAAALIKSVMGGASLIDETEEEADPELERMKAEAAALRLASEKLVRHLLLRREQIQKIQQFSAFNWPSVGPDALRKRVGDGRRLLGTRTRRKLGLNWRPYGQCQIGPRRANRRQQWEGAHEPHR